MIPALVVVSSALRLVGTGVYLKNTIFGKTKPNRITFLVWSAGSFIGFTGAVVQGWSWALLPVLMTGFGPALIFFASFANKRAYWQLGPFDYVCGVAAVAALLLWQLTANPNIAILFAILADALGSIPTFIKAWRFPNTETGAGYFLALVNGLIGLCAVQTWTFHEAAFLVYLDVTLLYLVLAVYRHGFFSRFKREIMHWGQEMEG